MLVSPLAHVFQRQPFDEGLRSLIEETPAPTFENKASADIQVSLNIYDVTHDGAIQKINGIFAHSMSPMKLGGVFHVGIQVLGEEWAYGWTRTGSGITRGEPRCELQHRFRETVALSPTKLSSFEIERVIQKLSLMNRGRDYHMIERNCCHFAEEFCQLLGVESLPAWVQRMGQVCEGLMKASRSLKTLQAGLGSSCGQPQPEQQGPSECRSHQRTQSRSQNIAGSMHPVKISTEEDIIDKEDVIEIFRV